MATAKQQKCEGCGKVKRLSMCSGDLLCSSCAALAGSISNRPGDVARMIIKRGQTERILEGLGVNQVAAVAVESKLLEKLGGLVGYTGDSGDELFDKISEAVEFTDTLRGERYQHIDFIIKLREILHLPICTLQELLDTVKNAAESAELDARKFDDDYEAKKLLQCDIACALEIDASGEILQDDLVAGCKALNASFVSMRLQADLALAEAEKAMRRHQADIHPYNMVVDQLSEAERKLLEYDQIFERLRELLLADGLDPHEIPQALDRLLRPVAEEFQPEHRAALMVIEREALADFGLKVIRGDVKVCHREEA